MKKFFARKQETPPEMTVHEADPNNPAVKQMDKAVEAITLGAEAIEMIRPPGATGSGVLEIHVDPSEERPKPIYVMVIFGDAAPELGPAAADAIRKQLGMGHAIERTLKGGRHAGGGDRS